MASSLLDVCRFNPTLGGTTDWTYSSAVTGYQSPAAAGVVNAATYSYRAESADLSQWEIGTGTYNTGTGVLTRTTVLFNSAGTTAKISFSTVPQVAIVALAEDLQGKLTAGQIPGTATNDSATAGNVGEYLTSTVLVGAAVSCTSGVAKDVTSLSLTAGDWDVWGTVITNPGGTTTQTQVFGWTSTTSATVPTVPGGGIYGLQAAFNAGAGVYAPVSPLRYSLAGTTTVFLTGLVSFGTSTNSFYGVMYARRRR